MAGGNIIVRPLGQIAQALSAVRDSIYQPPPNMIQGINEQLFPNPLQPVTPMGPPGSEPLGWPFNWGQNLLWNPRADAEYTAEQLRRFAVYPLARICIENNKDVLTRMPFKIQLRAKPGETSKARAERAKGDKNIEKITRFFERPNHESNWEEFWRPVLEDMLVIDAPSVFIGRTLKGEVAELRWVEGASITRMIDQHGWTPKPPSPAYQQLWQGYPRIDLTTEQLVYKPRNIVPRNTISSYLYGMSPTEQMAEEIRIGWSRLQYVYDFYGEGTIPQALQFAPLGTPPDKIKEAQQWLDSDLGGMLAKRRRLRIIQGFRPSDTKEDVLFPKEPTLADLFDEVHIRKICFAYGTSPTRLMRSMNRASADQNQLAAEEEGTLPFLNWFKSYVDYIIQVVLAMEDYEIIFDPFHEMDKLKQAMADAEDIKIGLYTRNEKREARGDDPRPEPEADELNILTGQGVLGIGEKPQAPGGAGGSVSGVGVNPQPRTTANPKTGASSGEAGAGEGKSSARKVDGNGNFAGCPNHSSSYPRTYCADCVKARIVWEATHDFAER